MTFNKFLKNIYYYYPVIIKALFKVTGIIYNIIQSLIISIGALVILVALVIVEHHRFSIAISFFEKEPLYVAFGAAFLVMAILFFSVQIVVTDHKHKYREEAKHRFSLRFLIKDIAYFIGISKEFSPIEKPPSHTIRQLKNFLVFVAMVLAAVGSLKEQIEANGSMPFVDGLYKITLGANFESGITTIVVILFTFVIVILSSNATSNITKRALEILEEVEGDRQETIQREKQQEEKSVVKVRNISELDSRALSRYAVHPNILPDDLINIDKHDFYDSLNNKWLRDGDGYATQTTLMKNIDKVLEARKHSVDTRGE